jgi:hypothetical protein
MEVKDFLDDGPAAPRCTADRFLRVVGGRCVGLRQVGEALMNWLYALGGIVALLIKIYLVIALQFPAQFW